MGWRGSARHWQRYEVAYLLLAGLATPLVVSVHTVVSFDFAVAILPGWHSTIFPPYFVAGAIYSGFAMVLVLAIPLRTFYGLQDFITQAHLQNMAKVMLATGLIVGYGYGIEAFMGWYSGNIYEQYSQVNRMFGPYGVYYWLLHRLQRRHPASAVVQERPQQSALVVRRLPWSSSCGMWLERFVIVVTSLHRDYLPSSWGMYSPTVWDWSMFLGTIGLFFALMFLFVRFLPMISIAEMQTLLPESQVQHDGPAGAHARRRTDGHLSRTIRPARRVRHADGAGRRPSARLDEAGYTRMDAYSPFPIEELSDALGFRRTKMPLLILLGGITGAVGGLRLAVLLRRHQLSGQRGRPAAQQLAVVYPGDVRADDPVRVADGGVRTAGAVRSADAVSSAVPCAALCAGPRAISFFLCIEAADPRFDRTATNQFLTGLNPREVSEVPQ